MTETYQVPGAQRKTSQPAGSTVTPIQGKRTHDQGGSAEKKPKEETKHEEKKEDKQTHEEVPLPKKE